MTEVMPPSRKDMVLKMAVASAGLQSLLLSYVHCWSLVLKPSMEPRNTKIRTAKTAMKTLTYWYSVKRKEVAPVITINVYKETYTCNNSTPHADSKKLEYV